MNAPAYPDAVKAAALLALNTRGVRTASMAEAVGVLAELRIAHPVPLVLNAPALPDQSQQGFWRGAQAGDVDEVGRRP